MKIQLSWLKDFIDSGLTPTELAEKLTMSGTEAEKVLTTGDGWDNVVVGQITAVNPHPNADRLSLPTVDTGTGEESVVCGAPNLSVGDKIAFAFVGAKLIDGHNGERTELKTAKIRGVASSGMVCSEKELGISDSHEGILVLPPEAPVGTPLADYLGDTMFDLDVTPNRPDCLCVIGIAREVAALTGQSLHPPEVNYAETGSDIDEHISVEIADPDLCARYCATLITGVKIGPSPAWMQQRLLACGMRPISNIVDVTNYVMMEMGQPLHAFDYEKIRGRKIIVRRAREGEPLTSLDGVERKMTGDMLVIADEARAVAIAGIMGGANSEVTDDSTSILLEAANFNPVSVHHTGSKLSLPSEACMRFERGIRPELAIPAIRRATQLIVQVTGGQAAQGMIDVFPGRQDHQPIRLTTGKIAQILGVEFTAEEITGALTGLGFSCRPGEKTGEIMVTAPYWRSDISQAVDLIEEVARIIGYDAIPTTMLSQSIPQHHPAPILSLKRKTRESLTGYGFQEIITYSLNSLEMMQKLNAAEPAAAPRPLRLINPMTVEQEYLRPNLRVNLLTTLAANRRHEDGGIRLFEQGKVYLPRPGDLPEEPESVCGVLGEERREPCWQGNDGRLDFYDAKGIVEGMLDRLGVDARFEPGDDAGLHPARQAAITLDKQRVGVIGELHPNVAEAYDIEETIFLFEVNLSALAHFATGHKMFQPIARFPATVRDIALITDADTGHQAALDIIRGFPLVTQAAIFDVYSGEQVPAGKKSLAYRITYQSTDHTLTDKEVDRVQHQILGKLLHVLGATLRG